MMLWLEIVQKENQSAEGAGGLGIIRGNKVGESMLNLHCNKNGKQKNKMKKLCDYREPRKYGFKIHRDVHYAMEPDGINPKNN